MVRRCCKNEDCSEPIELFTADDWSIQPGGSISPDFVFDGEVNPGQFITAREAYQFDFELFSGSVVFAIDGESVTVDWPNRTVSIGANSNVFGRTAYTPPSGPGATVHVRVTPSHIIVQATAMFSDVPPNLLGANPVAHGAVVFERDGSSPPLTFTATWTNAEIGSFEIRDSEVTFDAGGDNVKYCWVPPPDTCPYHVIEKITKSHKYVDDPRFNFDLAMPDLVVTGYETISGATRVTDRKPMWPFMPPGIADPSVLTGSNVQEDWAQAAGYVSCGNFQSVSAYYDVDYSGFNKFVDPPNTLVNWRIYLANGNSLVQQNTPSAADPYPVPFYWVTLAISYLVGVVCGPSFTSYRVSCDGLSTLSVPVNDISNGFTISVQGIMYAEGTRDDGVSGVFEIDQNLVMQEMPPCSDLVPNCCSYLVEQPYQFNLTLNEAIRIPGPIDAEWTV